MTRQILTRGNVFTAVALIGTALGLLLVRPTVIVGESMKPALKTWDFCLMLRQWHYAPRRGDIVMFRTADDPPLWFIKRVIALPGETVTIQGGSIRISGRSVPESYTVPNNFWNMPPTTVPAGKVFVLGDNRTVELEETLHGLVATRLVKGRLLWSWRWKR